MRISDWSADVCSSDLDRATYWEDAERRISDAYLLEKVIKTPANFIVHSLQEVNDALAHGRVFFMEIVKDGVILYQSDDKELGKPKPKNPEMALQAAQEYFAEYMSDATAFFDGYRDAVAREHLRKIGRASCGERVCQYV